MKTGGVLAVLLGIAAVVAYSTFFTVDQTSQALVVRLGKPVRVIKDPGLNVKIPFVDSVILIPKWLLTVESPAQEVIAANQDGNSGLDSGLTAQAGERLVVDAFARYRISDPRRFYQTVGPAGAEQQLVLLLDSTLRRVLGGVTLIDVVRNQRAQLMEQMRKELDQRAREFGIDVVDVRIRRADFPEQNSQAVYKRMQTEREREAAQFRAEGAQKAQEIRAKADRDVTVLIAQANSKGQVLRGQGDGESNAIYAKAFSQDPGFFSFYRSMRAYQKSMAGGKTNLVLGPDLDFFRYFGNPSGGGPVVSAAVPPGVAADPPAGAPAK